VTAPTRLPEVVSGVVVPRSLGRLEVTVGGTATNCSPTDRALHRSVWPDPLVGFPEVQRLLQHRPQRRTAIVTAPGHPQVHVTWGVLQRARTPRAGRWRCAPPTRG